MTRTVTYEMDFSALSGISPLTIREHLEALERRRLPHRVRGGAVRADGGDERPGVV